MFGPRRTRTLALVVALGAGAVACSGDNFGLTATTDGTADGSAGEDSVAGSAVSVPGATGADDATADVTTPPPVEQFADVALAIEPVTELPKPTAMAHNPADDSLWFLSQTGEVWRSTGGAAELVLDLTATVSDYETGSERGLLGIAFNPLDGRVFLYYTDKQAQSHVVSYALDDDGAPDPTSIRRILDIDQPAVGHKGGGMSFDDGGILYLAVGDGGGSRGRDAQDYTKLLGGIIRIVPRLDAEGYDLPADNPYLGDDTKRPELWAKGLRNPWGFWRDPVTGDLWTGDVGENTVEEVDRIPAGVAGANLGWYFLEGNQVNHPGAPADTLGPVWTYRHDEYGPAVIGGRVYRGQAIPALRGAYVFADMAGSVFAMGADDEVVRLGLLLSGVVTGWGTDGDGELYVLTHTQGAFRVVPA